MGFTRSICIAAAFFFASLAIDAFLWAGWNSDSLQVRQLLVGVAYLVAIGFLAAIAKAADPMLPLWLRLAGVIAFVVSALFIGLGFDDVRWPREVSVMPPLVIFAGAPLAWGAYVALDHEDRDGLRAWVVLGTLGGATLSLAFQSLPALPGIGRPWDFEPLYIFPTLAVAAAAAAALFDPAPVFPRVSRWALAYVILVLAMFIIDSYDPDPVWAFFQFIFYIPLFAAAAFLVWVGWKVMTGRGLPEGLSVLGGGNR